MCGENGTGKESAATPETDESSASAGAAAAKDPQPEDLSPVLEGGEGGGLKSRLESLLPMLASARGFYSNLPDSVCAQPGTPFQAVMSDDQSNCWNGQRFGEYTKPISGIGIGAQKYNAEVRVSRSDVDSHLVQLSDRLRHVRQVLISKTVAAPDPDSFMADFGSGSSGDGAGGVGNGNGAGSRRGGLDGTDSESDDDDGPGSDHGFPDGDLDGSGSGQGPTGGDWDSNSNNKADGRAKKPGTDDIELGETTPRATASPPTGGSSRSSGRTSISAVLWALCVVLTTVISGTSSSSSYSIFRRYVGVAPNH